MGFKLITDDKPATIYRKDRTTQSGNTWTTYCTKVSSKDMEGNWNSAFIDVAFKKGIDVPNKSKIKIKESFPTISVYNEKASIKWMIMDFEIVEEGQTQVPDVNGFINIEDDLPDGLPF